MTTTSDQPDTGSPAVAENVALAVAVNEAPATIISSAVMSTDAHQVVDDDDVVASRSTRDDTAAKDEESLAGSAAAESVAAAAAAAAREGLDDDDDDDSTCSLTFEMIPRNSQQPITSPQSQQMTDREAPDVGEEEKEEVGMPAVVLRDDDSFANALDDIEVLSNQVALSTVLRNIDIRTRLGMTDTNAFGDIDRMHSIVAHQADQVHDIRMRHNSTESNHSSSNNNGNGSSNPNSNNRNTERPCCKLCPIGLF